MDLGLALLERLEGDVVLSPYGLARALAVDPRRRDRGDPRGAGRADRRPVPEVDGHPVRPGGLARRRATRPGRR